MLSSTRGLLAAVMGLCATAAPAQVGTPFEATAEEGVVTTAQGDLLGFVDDGIYTYRGVPYAQAERFMAPEPPESWEGLRLAMNYGEICPFPDMDAVAGDEQFNPHRYLPESEDCQFLNIWTPGLDDGANRPVMVWLHGGGFTNGSSIENLAYEGRNLAEKGDVVVVSLNHRLNVLGALDLSAYGERYAESANTGMRDIVAALEWIEENIAAFGGDPENVTVFGNSGGGTKTRVLMGIPAAEGLLDKAVVQSGATPEPAMPQDTARAIAEGTLANLGLTPETVSQIETVPYDELLAAADAAREAVEGAPSWRPVVDGGFIPADPVEEGWAQHATGIPLLIGSVLNEFETVITRDPGELLADNKRDWTPERTAERLEERFGADAEAVAAAWGEAYPDRPLAEAYFWDAERRQHAVDHAELKASQGGAPVYAYVFAWESPVLDGVAGAWHVSEIPHVFDNVELVPQATGGGDDAKAMAHAVSEAWINFARTGDPNHPGLPAWPPYTPETGATMIFDSHSEVRENHDQELLEIVNADDQEG